MKHFLKNLLSVLGALGTLCTPTGIAVIVGVAVIAVLMFITVMVVLLHQGAYERCIGIIGAWKGGKRTK